MIAILLVALIVIGVVGYAGAGFAYTEARVASTDAALNTVTSHQNQLLTAFGSIDQQWQTLKSTSNFNVAQAQSLIEQALAGYQAASKVIDRDDTSLVSASQRLDEQQWLTRFSQRSLDREAARIAHARKALGSARTVVTDYMEDTNFTRALFAVLADLDKLASQVTAADVTGAKATATAMKTDADSASQLSTAPGLPPEVHALMTDFESLVGDYGKLLDVVAANDDAGIVSTEQLVSADADKIAGYDFNKINSEINAYYKPYIDAFNSEMAAATA